MKKIPFYKYTTYGNNFIIVDELNDQFLGEEEKSQFAISATDLYSGIGADNVVYLQNFNTKNIAEFEYKTGHKLQLPHLTKKPDYIIRFFEPDGSEFLNCGNALTCVAMHLYRKYNIHFACLLTELPSLTPKSCEIRYQPALQQSYISLHPNYSKILNFAHQKFISKYKNNLAYFKTIKLKDSDTKYNVHLKGIMVYTGEPHIVIFDHFLMDKKNILNKCILNINNSSQIQNNNFTPILINDSFLNKMGMFFNFSLRDMLPYGCSVNFASVLDKNGIIAYRCFERGVNKETLACGTGALAVALAAYQLGYITSRKAILLPQASRVHKKYLSVNLSIFLRSTHCINLIAKPSYIYMGTYEFTKGGV